MKILPSGQPGDIFEGENKMAPCLSAVKRIRPTNCDKFLYLRLIIGILGSQRHFFFQLKLMTQFKIGHYLTIPAGNET